MTKGELLAYKRRLTGVTEKSEVLTLTGFLDKMSMGPISIILERILNVSF